MNDFTISRFIIVGNNLLSELLVTLKESTIKDVDNKLKSKTNTKPKSGL